jgi:hypothetical protein
LLLLHHREKLVRNQVVVEGKVGQNDHELDHELE